MSGLGPNSLAFWAAAIAGLLLVVPLSSARSRALALAGVNLGVLLFTQRLWFGVTLVLVLGSYLAARLIAKGLPRLCYPLALAVVVVLFCIHKSPLIAESAPPMLSLWLSTLGYSYFALRLIDELNGLRDGAPAPTLVEHVNYLLPFHMLVAGPIQSFKDFRDQPPVSEPLSFVEAMGAFERIALGLFKKLALAHVIERVFLTGFRSQGLYYFLEVQLFLVWLYLDFSSYSDIAVGLGRLLGIRTPENFNRPYLARDMIEFWQRWHISLSEWIRRNVFIPVQLELQRRTRLAPLQASSIVVLVAFGLCGLWHTVSLRYAAWGLMHAAGVIAANYWRGHLTKKLGRAEYKQYLSRPIPLWVGRAMTFEFVAWSLAIVASR